MQFYFKLCASLVCGSSTATTANVVVGANGVSSAKRGLVRAVSLSHENHGGEDSDTVYALGRNSGYCTDQWPFQLGGPICLVSCAGRSQRTEIVRSQNNVNFERMSYLAIYDGRRIRATEHSCASV